jgi:hypothetical protein
MTSNPRRNDAEVATSIDCFARSRARDAKPMMLLWISRAANARLQRGSCNFRRLARRTDDKSRRAPFMACEELLKARPADVEARAEKDETRALRSKECAPTRQECSSPSMSRVPTG